MRNHHRSQRGQLILLLVLPLLFWLLAAPAFAQQTAPAQPATADLEALLNTLENDGERQRLVENIRALLEAQRAKEAADDENLGSRLMGHVAGEIGRATWRERAAGVVRGR